jgi:uncharacterized protein (DUF983 family)
VGRQPFLGDHDKLVVYPPSPLAAGLYARRPACGKETLLGGLLTMFRCCKVCSAGSSTQGSGDGLSAFIVLIGGLVVFGVLFVEVARQWSIWLPLAVIFMLAIMRPGKAFLITLPYPHRSGGFGPGA